MAPDSPRFLTAAEAADRLGVSRLTVYRLIRSGDLPAVPAGRSHRIPESALDDVAELGLPRAS